jgi:multidrug efflux pump subunit AcrB
VFSGLADIDTVRLTKEVETALAELNRTLPHGIKADNILFRQANFIQSSVDTVTNVLFEALAVVAVVLFAFLLNWRTTAISLTAIPVSILSTAIIFHLMGLSIGPQRRRTGRRRELSRGDGRQGHRPDRLSAR